MKLVDERERRFAVLRHAALQHEIGEILFAENFGFALPQLDDAPHELRVVEFAADADRVRRLPNFFAQRLVFEIFERGTERRLLQREQPRGLLVRRQARFFRRFQRGGLVGRRQPGKQSLVRDDFAVGVRRVQHVLRKFLRDRREFPRNFRQLLLLFRRKVGAAVAEAVDDFL